MNDRGPARPSRWASRRAGAALLLWSAATVAAPSAVHDYRLDNGLRLIVKEDHRAPVVVSQVWYKVGSSYEHLGLTGVSHVLEHMMFKGTREHAPGAFSRIIAANGGSENAFTGRDYTAYFQSLESSRLPISFELEADRMRNLLLPTEEFQKEIKVVMEERRMRTEDNPQALTYEQFNAAAFVSSPYQWPIIGWMGDLQDLTVDDARRWYRTWYAPNNATVVVAGDVSPEKVLAMAEKYFGSLEPEQPLPQLKTRSEVAPRGLREVIVKAPARLPYLVMGYQVPVVKSADVPWEPYALDVLAWILDGDSSSRLSRNLVRGSQIAASTGVGYNPYSRATDLFVLSGTPAPGKSVAGLRKALLEQVDELRETPVTEDELKRVKAQVVADAVYQKDSLFYQAMQIGMLVTVGLDWRLDDKYVERIRAVTPEQVREVARKYLAEDRLTVAMLDPQPIEPGHPIFEGPVGGADVH